ncbi:hypothetical protein [Pontibacillus chungwhensis]|uniref:hypothetical protein n=1 Tax=Pontibacillus chungwhensis TaxID=265426 RepID=UPI000AB307FE|nr:hypothetical protein [Pontibacillus chungwhensis]
MNKTIGPTPYKKIYLPFNEIVAPTTVKRIERNPTTVFMMWLSQLKRIKTRTSIT